MQKYKQSLLLLIWLLHGDVFGSIPGHNPYWWGSDKQMQLWGLCTEFNRNHKDGASKEHKRALREERFKRLEELLAGITKYEINAFDSNGQTLAHRLAPLADVDLYGVLIKHGLDISVKSREKNNYSGSTPAHILAGILSARVRKKHCQGFCNKYTDCLRVLVNERPELLSIRANNSKTVLDILGCLSKDVFPSGDKIN